MSHDTKRLKTNNGIKKSIIDSTSVEYIINGPFRSIKPYYYTYKTYCKERWRNKLLIDILSSEFRLFTKQHYINTIKKGLVLINDNIANLESYVKNGDFIKHTTHRHEPIVSSGKINIVYQDDDILIVDKPAGLPVHPTGRYNYNSLTQILKFENNIIANPCNRLDRLTSGLMIMGKNPKGCDKMVQLLKTHSISKIYIARVIGEFPINELMIDKPILTYDPKLSLNIINEKDGKLSITKFKRLYYDSNSNTSLVLCEPKTGRTHQIRVHLQYLGHAIVDDPIYSNEFVWGEKLGFNNEYDILKVRDNLSKIGKSENSSSWLNEKNNLGKGEILSGLECEECGIELYSEPIESELGISLHCLGYESNDSNLEFSYYSKELPKWVDNLLDFHMKLALKEAEKCPATKTSFRVGAILTYKGEIISKGYSNELPGNTHAEENCINKYLQKYNNLPIGCELFTTMEPCIKRLSGKKSCTNIILENKEFIKTIFVGCKEPDKFIKMENNTKKTLINENLNYFILNKFKDEAIKIAEYGNDK
ncbi:hypothetical protein CANARDRAFT_22463 [[Candida] arabinofermentans NRRL YB-2248]|uniref:CMP/dCMP-type deaminase domain-containing protein n=1 Tax=[Candida] arabinofermentans NRRL YB-2248 TaxID=983967 RepID=A0A1E4T1N3_9ASCO|nr:hypothetical protein CANARDRAFT_22463 [[Candida] arabinofermentans NRRL YB-2248]